MTDAISIDSVFLNYGNQLVLNGVHLTFHRHRIVGILGRNGCGKSSFLKVLIGHLNPTSKYIKYDGRLIQQPFKHKGLINYLPQHHFHPKLLSVSTIIQYYGLSVESFLDEYAFFKEEINHVFGELSGGKKRLLEVLLVLEAPTKFTILDEPFSHIMPLHVELITEKIKQFRSRKGILLTDHQHEFVTEIADEIYLMTSGTLRPVESEEDLRFLGYVR
ncbi:MAG: ATP-binding cassette domain-containing protein [Bacteroidota bacterium]